MGRSICLVLLKRCLLSSPLGFVMADSSGTYWAKFPTRYGRLLMAARRRMHHWAALSGCDGTDSLLALSYITTGDLVIVAAYVTSTQYLGNSCYFYRQLDYQKTPYTIASTWISAKNRRAGGNGLLSFNYLEMLKNRKFWPFYKMHRLNPVVHCIWLQYRYWVCLVHFNGYSRGKKIQSLKFYRKIKGVSGQGQPCLKFMKYWQAQETAPLCNLIMCTRYNGVNHLATNWRNYLHQASLFTRNPLTFMCIMDKSRYMCLFYDCFGMAGIFYLPRIIRLSRPNRLIKVWEDRSKIIEERPSFGGCHTVVQFLTLNIWAVAYFLSV